MLINGFTFGVDMTLLTVLHSGFAVASRSRSRSATCAFTLAFFLNRTLELPLPRHRRAAATDLRGCGGDQLRRVHRRAADLTGGGRPVVPPRQDRRGGCEALYMYTAMRLVPPLKRCRCTISAKRRAGLKACWRHQRSWYAQGGELTRFRGTRNRGWSPPPVSPVRWSSGC